MKDLRTRLRADILRLATGLLAGWLASQAQATPYASGISNNSGTISFILNEAATDVSIVYGNAAATNDLGSLGRGINSFSLTYQSKTYTNYAIVVYKAGSGSPSQISVDGVLDNFYGPRGVAVNRNPKTHDFGRTYVANANPGNSGVRTVGRGVYVVNADQSDAVGYGATAHPTSGISFGSSTTYAPYKISVGPDNMVYLGDASGALGVGTTVGGGVWMLDPDLTNATDLFVFNGTSTGSGLVCVPATPIVSGSLAAGNLVLYTVEWNRTPYNNIWQYNIGGGPLPWTATPTELASAGIPASNEVIADLGIAPDGKFFASEDRDSATGGNVSLWVYASDGLSYLWDSETASGGNDPFYNSYGMAVSPDDQYVATGTGLGTIDLCQLTNGIPDLSTFTTITFDSDTPTVRGVAWDAADNLYGVSGTDDLLRVFSLGLTATAITANDATCTNGTFSLTISTNLPTITVQPQSQSVLVGSNVAFSVTALGAPTLSYQWQLGGTNLTNSARITGAQSTNLAILSLVAGDAGNYQVVVTNGYGSVTSAVAVLTVLASLPQPNPWTQLANSPGPNSVRHDDIYFTDPTNGWASQDNYIYRTTNGGLNWTTNLNLPGTHFRSVCFATPQVGFGGNLGVGSYDGGVTDTNVLYRSYDGGVTWSNVDGFAEAGMKGLCAMYVLDAQHIYGGGRVRGPAFFIKSVNGGTNWTMVNLTAMGVMNAIMDVYFQDPTNGWVVGMDTNAYSSTCATPYHGRIARTTDGGNTWTAVVTTPIDCSYFWKMSWPATNVGYASLQQNGSYSNVVFYKTTDGGDTWVSNAIPEVSVGLSTNGYNFYLQGLGFVSTNEGWIGGASGLPSYTNSFLHTTDGGATWSPVGFNDTFLINRIRFLNPTLGFAAGANLYTFSVPLAITAQPQSQIVLAGTNVSLSVTALGKTPIGYQWQKNGSNQPGATSSTLTLTNVTRTAEGTYLVVVTNAAASLASSNAVIRVLAAERLSEPTLLPGGRLQLLFNDADGGALLTSNDVATFEVLASSNLVEWTVITNALTLTNGSVVFQDSTSNYPARFYRVLEH